MMRHLIITCVDDHYGTFLVNHWLKSLRANVNLTHIDIAILDYGLNDNQKKLLKKERVITVPCAKTDHIVNSRFADASRFLDKTNYDQICFVDGGDILFQDDISCLFEQDKDSFRLVKLDAEVLFFEAFIPFNFNKNKQRELYSFLKDKPVLNAGFILAPRDQFIEICHKINTLITNKKSYGPDQVALNYFVYHEKVKLLDRKYNFMIATASENFFIKNGVFYLENGEKIAVVHNAGHNRLLRPIDNFGYGKTYNRLNFFGYTLRRLSYKLTGFLKPLWST